MKQDADSPNSPGLLKSLAEEYYHHRDKGRLLIIEILVLIGAVFLTFVFIFGSHRRRSTNKALKYVLWTANTLNYTYVSYVVGFMMSTPFPNSLFPIWAVFMAFVFGSADSFSAFSLEDNDHWKIYYVQQQFQLGLTGAVIGKFDTDGSRLIKSLWVFLMLINLKLVLSAAAFKLASQSSYGFLKADKLVADYMMYEHQLGNPDETPNPAEMKGYNYLVYGGADEQLTTTVSKPGYLKRIEITSNKIVTVDKIWHCKGMLLNAVGDPVGLMLKDVCLSFALFKLLRRRFSGYPLGEQHLQKTQDFVFKGLLKEDDNDNDCERAFKVIEEELAFLFDFFYTKYPIIFETRIYNVTSLLMLPSAIWLTGEIFQIPNNEVHIFRIHGKNDDTILTIIIMLFVVIIELVQLARYVTSNWAKVWLVSKYVAKESCPWLEKLIWFFCRWGRLLPPWQRKIGQYSLLKSFRYRPCKAWNLLSGLTFGIVDKTREVKKQGVSIELPVQVKKAVILSLRASEGRLTNGTRSLQQNGVSALLSWACGLETQTHTILVWHIATTLCELADSRSNLDEISSDHRNVAISLSNYCAYLVAFVPKLLPDHSYTTEVIFDQVVSETRVFLNVNESMTNRYTEMMNLALGDNANTIVQMAAKLGKQLIEKIEDEGARWKIVGEFWAELMLFVAPSDEVTAHAECLAHGGEFVTHLWALLSHAGILERDPPAPRSPPQSELV